MLIGCLVVGLVLTGLAGIGVRQIVRLNDRFDNYDRALGEFFAASTSGEISPFSEVVNSVANVIGERQALVTQASIRGAIGGTQRTINQGLEDVAKTEIPGLAMVDVLPKSLKKNPLALAGLQALMARANFGSGPGSTGPGSSGGNHSADQAKFQL